MLTLVLSYFFVEIFVGFLYKSLALVADACHMLSDGLCLVIALIAIQGLDTTRVIQSKIAKDYKNDQFMFHKLSEIKFRRDHQMLKS